MAKSFFDIDASSVLDQFSCQQNLTVQASKSKRGHFWVRVLEIHAGPRVLPAVSRLLVSLYDNAFLPILHTSHVETWD